MRRDDLIIDVGMHVGHDTRFYLAKGFNVVAVEANPRLVELASEEFADEIAEGRLRILGVAIAEARGTANIAIAEEDGLSTMSGTEALRYEELGMKFRSVEVPTVPFDEIIGEVGIPYYLKVDIEGLDLLCARALHGFKDRPLYMSIESSITSAEQRLGFDLIFEEFAELWSLGYRSFKYVNQMRSPPLPNPPLEGKVYAEPGPPPVASGGFGKEAPGQWRGVEATLAQGCALRIQQEFGGHRGRWASLPPGLIYRGVRSRILQRPTGFFDLHARLGTAG